VGGSFLAANVRVIGKDIIEAKLARAEANILANNLLMTREMLTHIKAEVQPQVPIGPGHFGYHGRDTLKVVVQAAGPSGGQLGTKVYGLLKAASDVYWREFGTGMRYRGPKRKAMGVRIMTGQAGTGGEPARLMATHALAGIKKFINFYYGGLAKWWHV
jgi:hypothetical protein